MGLFGLKASWYTTAYCEVHMNCKKHFLPPKKDYCIPITCCKLNTQTYILKLMWSFKLPKTCSSLASYSCRWIFFVYSVYLIIHVADGAVFCHLFLRLKRRQIPLCMQWKHMLSIQMMYVWTCSYADCTFTITTLFYSSFQLPLPSPIRQSQAKQWTGILMDWSS